MTQLPRNTVFLFFTGAVSPWLWGWALWVFKGFLHAVTDHRYVPLLDGDRTASDLFTTPFDIAASALIGLALALPAAYFARDRVWVFWIGIAVGFLVWIVFVLPDFGVDFLLYFLGRPMFATYIVASVLGFWAGVYLKRFRRT